ncbi:MAG: HAMP domain-containing sensor histidine kinase [Pseudomonadota bacterium]
MSLWRPRSVLQLVLVGFFAALAPLCLAIFFTIQTLEDLAANNSQATRQIVDVTRLGHEIEEELLQLERHIRQYLTLLDPELALLAQQERALILQHLSELQKQVPDPGVDAHAIETTLIELDLDLVPLEVQDRSPLDQGASTSSLNHDFAQISDHRRGLQLWLQNWVDELQASNVEQAGVVVDALFVQLAFLAVFTLALLLLFTYWINKPVKELTEEIDQLGKSGLGHNIKISGPQELAQLGRKLDWLRQRLHDTEQQKEQFQRHISHELKTPLASLREGTDLLSEQVTGHLSQQQQQVVDIVRRNAIELQKLIENLVDYNDLPNQEPRFEDVNLGALWDDILANYQLTIDQKWLNVRFYGDVKYWVADEHKLRTTLDNLLSNAVNYCPEGGDIDVAWQENDGSLIVEIANSGDSIPTEDRARVFEPFFQSTAKRTGPIKGSGVGLSVARDCIESQGGSLNLVAHQTYPVCFRLTCPSH